MSTSVVAPTVADLLKYADLQMAAEAFIRDPLGGQLRGTGSSLILALVNGNGHGHLQRAAFDISFTPQIDHGNNGMLAGCADKHELAFTLANGRGYFVGPATHGHSPRPH